MTNGPFFHERPDPTISHTVALELLAALRKCADELQAEIEAHYVGYPHNQRRQWRDMETVREARAAIARAEAEL